MNIVKMSLGSAAVGLIILIDLATGQGPPGLNNYVGLMPPQAPLPEFRRPLPVRPLPAQYLPTGSGVDVDYTEGKKFEKELEKEASTDSKESSHGFAKFFEKSKDDGEKSKEHNTHKYPAHEYPGQKSYVAQEPNKAQFYGQPPAPGAFGSNYGPPSMYAAANYDKEKDKKGYKGTPAPGMLASLSHSMSKAWNSWG